MRIKITGYDNRGSATSPFGYIYFELNKSEWRVGYTSNNGLFAVARTPSDLKPSEISALIAYADKHNLANGFPEMV